MRVLRGILPPIVGALLGLVIGAAGILVAQTGVLVAQVVLLVALAGIGGATARHLAGILGARRDAEQQAEHRAELLATVVSAGRGMTTADSGAVLSAVADAAAELGFEAVDLSLYDDGSQRWRAVARRGDAESLPTTGPAEDGILEAVAASGDVVELEDPSGWTVPSGRDAGDGVSGMRTVLGCPVWNGDALTAVLTVGTTRSREVSAYERECLELLARQADAALALAQQFLRQRNLERELLRQAATDALTGAANRTRLFERIDDAVVADEAPIAVLFLDLDGFKAVNDRLGHQAGDELLRIIAQRLQRCLRPHDLLGRLGGDEFAVLLTGVADPEAALVVAERIQEAIRQPIALTAGEVELVASVGISYRERGDSNDRERLLSDADTAMYEAKAGSARGIRLGRTCAVALPESDSGPAAGPESRPSSLRGTDARHGVAEPAESAEVGEVGEVGEPGEVGEVGVPGEVGEAVVSTSSGNSRSRVSGSNQ
ncbi:GGDEF domain-containing protein [Egibacter rhizosphaerae]|uniref:GGDEF domain-containing protein n=1 Tax=Egibacter rhizosphaerae TaxID=1670831 RepID=A0A411YAI1_9ACTN|nr:GGDEF domain-containing protein [Egibacter rhizosphaerae]